MADKKEDQESVQDATIATVAVEEKAGTVAHASKLSPAERAAVMAQENAVAMAPRTEGANERAKRTAQLADENAASLAATDVDYEDRAKRANQMADENAYQG
jgi:hypothetical protein